MRSVVPPLSKKFFDTFWKPYFSKSVFPPVRSVAGVSLSAPRSGALVIDKLTPKCQNHFLTVIAGKGLTKFSNNAIIFTLHILITQFKGILSVKVYSLTLNWENV